jgi:hypothetical protein
MDNDICVTFAEMVGFTAEGVERVILQWQGILMDLVHYRILRREWGEANQRREN